MIDIRFSAMADRLRSSEIRDLLKLTRTADVISFAGGLPDPTIFPYESVKQAAVRAIDERGCLSLQYSPTDGEPYLKGQIAGFMARQGDAADPAQILVTASSQQGLDLLGKVFIDRGDPIILEKPSYLGALQAFRSYDADFHGIEMDSDGVMIDRLEREIVKLIDDGRKPKFVYLIPDFQNPSGITLSYERRLKVLELASKYDLLIVEDSPYRELRYMGETLPSLYSMDKDGRVILMKTFSKIFCPGFRIGWMVGPSQILNKLSIAKQSADLCTSAFVSFVAANFIADGHLESQIEASKKIYSRKSKVMFDALAEYMPKVDGISWSTPEGGMFLWVTLPEEIDATEMIRDAVEAGVAYVIGQSFFCDDTGRNTMRLNYSFPTDAQIVEGIKRLGGLVSSRLRERVELV
jgi:2-aminoadipate transaminase